MLDGKAENAIFLASGLSRLVFSHVFTIFEVKRPEHHILSNQPLTAIGQMSRHQLLQVLLANNDLRATRWIKHGSPVAR